MSRWGASCIRTLLWPADHMNSHLHLALLGMYEVQPSAVKNAAVTAASLLGTGRRRYWEVDMPKLHEDGKDEILGRRERVRERVCARAGGTVFLSSVF